MDSSSENSIILYQSPDGSAALEVRLDHETVWLSQAQMVSLFNRDQSVISRHLRNVFTEGELDTKSNMQKMHFANSDKPVAFYSLDVIISVGYRVKSQQGTRFRQWATRVLHDHIVKGYTLNEQRLREESAKLQAMQQTVALLARTLTNQELVSDTGRDVLRVIDDYAYALATLDRYDHSPFLLAMLCGRSTSPFRVRSLAGTGVSGRASQIMAVVTPLNPPYFIGGKRTT